MARHYSVAKKVIWLKFPEVKTLEVKITVCNYTGHVIDLVTRRSDTGIMISVQSTISKLTKNARTKLKAQHMNNNWWLWD